MKKYAIILLLAAALMLTACSEDADTTKPIGNTKAATTQAVEATEEETHETISPEVPYPDGDKYYKYDCSADLDENGFFTPVDLDEYVTIPEDLVIKIPYENHTPADEEIQAEINDILDFYGEYEQVLDKVIEDGDSVNIDYTGTVDGVEFENGSTMGNGVTVTIGKTKYIDDFLEQLIGHKPGDTFNVYVTFPANYGAKQLAGMDAVFETTINYVQGELKLPEINDEFIKTNLEGSYGWTTVQQMYDEIEAEQRTDMISNYLYDKIMNDCVISEVPAPLKNYLTNYFITFYSALAEGNSVTLPDIVDNFGFENMRAMLMDYDADIEDGCKRDIVIQAIAKKLGIIVTEDDITDYFVRNFGREDYSTYTNDYGLPYVKKMVMPEIVLNKLAEMAEYLPKE